MSLTITRRRSGDSFVFYKHGKPVAKDHQERIRGLAIPPAWKHVEIADAAHEKVQARGKDASGKVQIIYHPNFRKRQDQKKFDRILAFAATLPALRRQIETDIKKRGLPKEKVVATCLSIIDETYFRVGNKISAQDGHHGITTLRSKHVDIRGAKIEFDFVGKSGQEHHRILEDAQLARLLRQLDDTPGYELFRYTEDKKTYHTISASDINEYIKEHAGEMFSAKDFRTWGGTLHATLLLAAESHLETKTERRKAVVTCVKTVAKKLGNTPSIARSSYIDPRIIEAYEDGTTLKKVYATVEKMKPKKYLTTEESCALHCLTKIMP